MNDSSGTNERISKNLEEYRRIGAWKCMKEYDDDNEEKFFSFQFSTVHTHRVNLEKFSPKKKNNESRIHSPHFFFGKSTLWKSF